MSSLISSLKSEITRVARKELKGELQSLRKVTTVHRSEIAALKRQLKSLAAELKGVKRTNKSGVDAPSAGEAPEKHSGIRFTAQRFAALRAKLGLTQSELAKVLDASSLSVHKWETGAAQPRAAQLAKIASAMKLGKREARALLQE
nr:helix-turn-helix domain-containing protein [Rhodoferax sp.]